MHKTKKIHSGSLTLSLSYALDLAEPYLVKHQQRVAYIVWRMGEYGKIRSKQLRDIFLAALFHDIGAFSIKEKKALKTFELDDAETHCIRGYQLLSNNFWLTKVAGIVRHHHRSWSEWKKKADTINQDIVLGSQLINLADYVERLIDRNIFILHQSEHIRKEIASLVSKQFHKYVVDLFLDVSEREEFWLTMNSPWLTDLLLKEGPLKNEEIKFSVLLPVSELFRNVIDFRSRFTATHSSGVAAAGKKLAEVMGFTKRERELLEIAGNFHDLGKLAIPDYILEKPNDLTEKEMLIMRSHVFYTFSILSSVEGLERVAELAGYHHERLDGSGYPFHLTEDSICIGSRILMVADLFTALIEVRPYRSGMDKREVKAVLMDMVRNRQIDENVVKTLFNEYDEIYNYVLKKQEETQKEYKERFSPLEK